MAGCNLEERLHSKIAALALPIVATNENVVTLLKTLLDDLTSNDSPTPSPRIPSLSLRPNKKTPEERKTIRPPPGFEQFQIDLDFDLSSPVSAALSSSEANSQPSNSEPSSSQPSNSQPSNGQANSQPTSSMPTEEQQQILINNYYLMNPAQLFPQLLLQEQYQQQYNQQYNQQYSQQNNQQYNQQYNQQNNQQYNQQNVYRPNPSNMPLGGAPLFQPPQNGSQRSLTYGSVVPPQNAYQNPHSKTYRQQEYRAVPPLPRNYMQMNVPVIHPTHGGFVLMNAPVPNQCLQVFPPNAPNRVGNASANAQGYGQGDFVFLPPSVQAVRHQPSPFPRATPTPPPTTPRSVPSPAPTYTPVTIPEWPPTNLPTYFTSASTGTKIVSCSQLSAPASPKISQSPEVNLVPRPCTPLTPASAEVANICKQSQPNSSAPHDSGSQSASSQNNISPFDNTSSKSQIDLSPIDKTSSQSQINISPLSNTSSKSQINISPLDNISSHTQIYKSSEKIEHNSRSNSDPSLSAIGYRQSHKDVNDLPLPPDVDTKEIPLPPPSPERLYSAISSPVDSLVRASPLKEESSDDYASASENIEEAKRQLADLILTEKYSVPAVKPAYDPSEDIPDSWENLDLDDTPAKAANFSVDFSQPLDLIIQNIESESTVKPNNPVEKSGLEVKSQLSPLKIHAPANWKDVFNPDIISSSERVDNNNSVKGKFQSPMKFNVKKVPVQKIEVQGKVLHLLNINNTPAVIALEFFSRFSTNNSVAVSEKVVEVSHNKMYYISRAEHPAILAELSKVDMFGDLQKKVVIRLNKVRVLNLSDIPQCLKVLNVPNKPLVDDLKKIANELASC